MFQQAVYADDGLDLEGQSVVRDGEIHREEARREGARQADVCATLSKLDLCEGAGGEADERGGARGSIYVEGGGHQALVVADKGRLDAAGGAAAVPRLAVAVVARLVVFEAEPVQAAVGIEAVGRDGVEVWLAQGPVEQTLELDSVVEDAVAAGGLEDSGLRCPGGHRGGRQDGKTQR